LWWKKDFIAGADGRTVDREIIVTENERKILSFDQGAIHLAYMWTGLTRAVDQDDVVVFDLRLTSQFLLPVASLSRDFSGLLTVFQDEVSQRLPKSFFDLGTEELARVRFVGYFGGQSCSAEIVICYPNSKLNVCIQELNVPSLCGTRIFSGAESILPAYVNPRTRGEAIDFVRNYIQECIDSAAPDCQGGHLHIAEVTRGGFSWVIPPTATREKKLTHPTTKNQALSSYSNLLFPLKQSGQGGVGTVIFHVP
jgi:hypothetical protein